MKVVTILTNIEAPGFNQCLKPSCEYYDLELVILQPDVQYSTHRVKDALLHEYLKELPTDDVILFTDGHDTALMAAEEEILTKFTSFDAPLVFSAEINCWPTPELETMYPASDKPFKFLNCGGFIGHVGYLLDLYEKNPLFSKNMKPEFNWSNQYYWHHVYFNNQDTIKLDHDCTLFYNTSTIMGKIKGMKFDIDHPDVQKLLLEEKARLQDEISFANSRIHYKNSGTYPCHLHFPGPISKMLMSGNFFEPIKIWSDN
jgi:hypothetical protein